MGATRRQLHLGAVDLDRFGLDRVGVVGFHSDRLGVGSCGLGVGGSGFHFVELGRLRLGRHGVGVDGSGFHFVGLWRLGLGRHGVGAFGLGCAGGGGVYFDRLGRVGGVADQWGGIVGVWAVFVGVRG